MQRYFTKIKEVQFRKMPTSRLVQALFSSRVECSASISSVVAILYAAFTGLFRAGLCGQAVSGWSLAMAVISTRQLLAWSENLLLGDPRFCNEPCQSP